MPIEVKSCSVSDSAGSCGNDCSIPRYSVLNAATLEETSRLCVKTSDCHAQCSGLSLFRASVCLGFPWPHSGLVVSVHHCHMVLVSVVRS